MAVILQDQRFEGLLVASWRCGIWSSRSGIVAATWTSPSATRCCSAWPDAKFPAGEPGETMLSPKKGANRMPDINPLDPQSPGLFGAFGAGFTVLFVLVFGGVCAVFLFVIYRLIRDRKKIAAYQAAMLELPGEILKATQSGDLAKAQLLQGQLVLMQQQQLLARRGMMAQSGFPPGMTQPGMPDGMPPTPTGMPGDFNGDGIPD